MASHEYTKPKLSAILQFIQANQVKKNNFVTTGTDPIRLSETSSWIRPLSHKIYCVKEQNRFGAVSVTQRQTNDSLILLCSKKTAQILFSRTVGWDQHCKEGTSKLKF